MDEIKVIDFRLLTWELLGEPTRGLYEQSAVFEPLNNKNHFAENAWFRAYRFNYKASKDENHCLTINTIFNLYIANVTIILLM